jgi:hypothetical protein
MRYEEEMEDKKIEKQIKKQKRMNSVFSGTSSFMSMTDQSMDASKSQDGENEYEEMLIKLEGDVRNHIRVLFVS